LALENVVDDTDSQSSDSMASDDTESPHAIDVALAELSGDLLGME
jgi:hypothetical protein